MREGDAAVGLVLGEKVRVRVLRRIDEGGMGTVYLAESEASGLPYAVKLLHPRLCQREDAVRRFLREALVASSVRHPGVVSVVDAGLMPDGSGYYVMELLTGENLATTLRREVRLPWPRVRHIALQICDAMAVVHATGIVHRDLKPANCFRTVRGADTDAIKIVDFGVAKVAVEDGSILTGAEALLGTAPYMAPELLRTNGAREGDRRADVWALAVTLQELLTGARPFQADNVFRLMMVIQQEPPETLAASGHVPDWPDGLQAIFDRALAKDPDDRYANMNALAVALRGLGVDPPIADFKPSATDPLATTAEIRAPRVAEDPQDDATPPAVADAASELVEGAVRAVRERAAFYVDPSSRWRPEPIALPGGAFFAVVRGDLCLERVDAIVCGVSRDQLGRETLARRLCEFGGPSVAKIAAALPSLPEGTVHRVPGGRLAAAHVFFAVLPDEFTGLDDARAAVFSAVAGSLDHAQVPSVATLAVPLFMPRSSGVSRRVCLQWIVEAFSHRLATSPPFTLGTLRLVIDDKGERATRFGGDILVRLPASPNGAHQTVQRFFPGNYPTMLALATAIWESLPARSRPAIDRYGPDWQLRDAQRGSVVTAADMFSYADPRTVFSAGEAPSGAAFELVLDEPGAAAQSSAELMAGLAERCAAVDWTAVTAGQKGRVPLLCSGYRNTGALLTAIWWDFPEELRPAPFSYGEAWVLRDRRSGERMSMTPDASLDAAGFTPGGEFEVIWLRS